MRAAHFRAHYLMNDEKKMIEWARFVMVFVDSVQRQAE
jgi:hypothetical protein